MRNAKIQTYKCSMLCLLLVLLVPRWAAAQLPVDIDLAMIDGVDIKPANVFQYSIISSHDKVLPVTVKGVISYRNTGHKISYSYTYSLQPGFNMIVQDNISPNWDFSSSGIRDLFFNYNLLPEGTYQYCISVSASVFGESVVKIETECVYRKAADIFMITLLEPENNAKIQEYNPLLSWVVNYPMPGELTYKLRLVEVKNGQNNANALARNNPIYSESNIAQTSLVYPVYAKPLKAFQPYAWTVDAYYRGILIGGAEPWRFTIIEDSIKENKVPYDLSYININKEKRPDGVQAIGKLKIKYDLRDYKTDTLFVKLTHDGEPIKLREDKLSAKHGDNRYEIEFTDKPKLRHNRIYMIEFTNSMGEVFPISFQYKNPDYLQ